LGLHGEDNRVWSPRMTDACGYVHCMTNSRIASRAEQSLFEQMLSSHGEDVFACNSRMVSNLMTDVQCILGHAC